MLATLLLPGILLMKTKTFLSTLLIHYQKRTTQLKSRLNKKRTLVTE